MSSEDNKTPKTASSRKLPGASLLGTEFQDPPDTFYLSCRPAGGRWRLFLALESWDAVDVADLCSELPAEPEGVVSEQYELKYRAEGGLSRVGAARIRKKWKAAEEEIQSTIIDTCDGKTEPPPDLGIACVCHGHGTILANIVEGMADKQRGVPLARESKLDRLLKNVQTVSDGVAQAKTRKPGSPNESDKATPSEPEVTAIDTPADSVEVAGVMPSPTSDPDSLGKEQKALAVLVSHPEWSDTKIADLAGCHRTSLYRWPKYVAAREALETGRQNAPRADQL